jgi:hypothetical protein
MKKQAKKKPLLLTVDKVRDLRPVDPGGLEGAAGGLVCGNTHSQTNDRTLG